MSQSQYSQSHLPQTQMTVRKLENEKLSTFAFKFKTFEGLTVSLTWDNKVNSIVDTDLIYTKGNKNM